MAGAQAVGPLSVSLLRHNSRKLEHKQSSWDSKRHTDVGFWYPLHPKTSPSARTERFEESSLNVRGCDCLSLGTQEFVPHSCVGAEEGDLIC